MSTINKVIMATCGCGAKFRKNTNRQKFCDNCMRPAKWDGAGKQTVRSRERMLARGVAATPEGNELVLSHLGLAKRAAKKMCLGMHQTVEYADLLSGACLGLLAARDKFDPSKGKFVTLAMRTVPGAIVDDLRVTGDRVRKQVEAERLLDDTEQRFYHRHGRRPTEDELRAGTGLSRKLFARAIHAGRRGRVDRSSIQEAIIRPPDEVARADWWMEMCRDLTRTEKTIILLYFRDGRTLAEIARVLGICKSRVSQVRISLLKRMKESPRVKRLAECAHDP